LILVRMGAQKEATAIVDVPFETRAELILNAGLLELYQSRGAVGHAVSNVRHSNIRKGRFVNSQTRPQHAS